MEEWAIPEHLVPISSAPPVPTLAYQGKSVPGSRNTTKIIQFSCFHNYFLWKADVLGVRSLNLDFDLSST